MISTCPLGLVPSSYAYRGGEDQLGGGFGLDANGFGDELAGERIAVGEQFEDDIGETVLGGADFVRVLAGGAVLAEMVHVVFVDGLAEVFELGAGEFGHQHSEPGVFVDPEFGFSGSPLTFERVQALFDQFLVGPFPGVPVEGVGEHLVGGFQQGLRRMSTASGPTFSAALARALT